MKHEWRNKFWQWWFRQPHWTESSLCANRLTRILRLGPVEVTLIFRDTSQSDGYERTEVYRMLRCVRQEEARQNWICPEPDESRTEVKP